MPSQLSYEQTRSLVVEVISQSHGRQLMTVVDAVDRLAQQRGLVADPNAQQNTGGCGPRIIATYDPNAGRDDLALPGTPGRLSTRARTHMD